MKRVNAKHWPSAQYATIPRELNYTVVKLSAVEMSLDKYKDRACAYVVR